DLRRRGKAFAGLDGGFLSEEVRLDAGWFRCRLGNGIGLPGLRIETCGAHRFWDTCVHRPAIEVRQSQVAVEAHALGESVAGGGIERARDHRSHKYLSNHLANCKTCQEGGAHVLRVSIRTVYD